MALLGQILVGILVLAHLLFFAMEFFWAELPSFQHKLGFTGDQDEVAIFAKNQAFSNLFLATGLAFGWACARHGKPHGRNVLRFVLACIFVAGVVGFFTVPASKPAFLALQSGPALLAFAGLGAAKK
jgi:uncharacterized membrane protein